MGPSASRKSFSTSYKHARLPLGALCLAIIFAGELSALDTCSAEISTGPWKVQIPVPTEQLKAKFNRDVRAGEATINKEDGEVLSGFVTNNKEFFLTVMKPLIESQYPDLRRQPPVEIINTLAQFGHEIYQLYFGTSYYRWAGDILDIDDPQIRGTRFEYSYGLDCSGFAAMPYEIAVYLGYLDPHDEGAVFSSEGFRIYGSRNNIEDLGGRGQTSNRYRIDTYDLVKLGREIIRVEEDESPTAEQLAKLQAGDVVVRRGHCGLIVESGGDLYYLESGGRAVPANGGKMVPAAEGLTIFAKSRAIMVRRALPDYSKTKP